MIDVIREMLSYPFLVRAIVVGLLVSLCASLLGVSLVLKRFSMIGDGLSHVGFGALAIGVMVVSMTTGMNTDVYNYMFGSILSLSAADATLSIVLSAVVLVLFVLFYPRLFAVTFDESFSRATGIPTRVYNAALATLSSITVVLGMRMMGALLISSLIIFPVLTAMRIGKRYLTVTLLSAAVAIVGFVVGMIVSYVYEAPSGASIVCVNIVLFLLFAIAGAIRNAVKKK